MKRGWKIFWIIISVIAGLGIVLSCVALGLGLSFRQIREAYPNGIGIVKEHTVEYKDDRDDDHEVYESTPSTDAVRYENVTRLEMRVGGCEVELLSSEDDAVWVDTSWLDAERNGKSVEVQSKSNEDGNGETLVVQMTDGTGTSETLLDMIDDCEYGTLYVYLPKDRDLEEVDLTLGAVDMEGGELRAKTVRIESGAADCSIENLQTEELTATVGAGNLEIEGAIRKNADVKCGVGNLELYLEGSKEDFNYTVKCGMGEVDIDEDIVFSGIGGSKKVDNGSSRNMTIDCGVGNVEVYFQ